METKEWTEQQLKEYKGELYINREFSDYGFAFGEELQIFTEESNTKPVYRQVFYGDGDCDEFLESIFGPSEEASEPPKKDGPFSLEGLESLEIPKFELKAGV